MGKLVKIKEASDILGVSIRILRGWDAKGIINTVRTPGGTRLFAVEDYLKSQEHAKTMYSLPEYSRPHADDSSFELVCHCGVHGRCLVNNGVQVSRL